MRSVTWFVSWHQKKTTFIQMAACRKQHEKVKKISEMHTVQNYTLSKTKQVY